MTDARAWRLTPGVLRLGGGRLAGGTPMRVVGLSDRGRAALRELLGSPELPATGSAAETLGRRLNDYGLLTGPPPPAVPVADVTIVIPALSDQLTVGRLIDRLDPAIPVVLVDDGSPAPLTGGSTGRANVTVVRHERPRGPAAARNAGAARAQTRWIAFLDADVTPPDGWLGRLLAHAEAGVVALAPRVRGASGRGLAAAFERRAGALDLGPVAADVGTGRLTYLPSAALLVDADAFRLVGGFDEDMHLGEDVDLVWRLLAHGRVRYCPSLTVQHAPRAGLVAALHRRFDYGTAAAALEVRHPGRLTHLEIRVAAAAAPALAVAAGPRAGLAASLAVLASAARPSRRPPALPRRDRLVLAAYAQVRTATASARWLNRPAWPLTAGLVLLTRGPRRRRLLLAGCVGALVPDGRHRPGPSRTADDLAYSLGVWSGCLRSRRYGPLLPRVTVAGGRG